MSHSTNIAMKHDMTSNQLNGKEIVSGRPRGRPYSA